MDEDAPISPIAESDEKKVMVEKVFTTPSATRRKCGINEDPGGTFMEMLALATHTICL